MSYPTAISSGLLTTDTQVYTGRGLYHGMAVRAEGAGNAEVTIYDGTDATGKVIDRLTVAGGEADLFHNFNRPVRVKNGIFAQVSVDTGVIVYFG